MQDPDTGDMIEFTEANADQLRDQLSGGDEISFEGPEMAEKAKQAGFCVIAQGEAVDINGGKFKIKSIGQKELILTCPPDVDTLDIKDHQMVSINKGNFRVKHFGKDLMFLRGVPGARPLDQKIIDDHRKEEIKRMRGDDENDATVVEIVADVKDATTEEG
tara:strand:+ start:1125 stop:1607 length:483 start_codon:yes stop_codon:yes gene_type:complete